MEHATLKDADEPDSSMYWDNLTPYSAAELDELEVMPAAPVKPIRRGCNSTDLDKPQHPPKRKLDLLEAEEKASKSLKVDDAKYHLIAYNSSIHDAVSKLPYGTQYILACLINSGQMSYSEVTSDLLHELQGSSSHANEVLARHIKNDDRVSTLSMEQEMFASEIAANSPWKELDKEEAALAKDPYAGLGNHPDDPDWYGGKVAFRGKLAKDAKGKFKVVLEDSTLGLSCRFARRFGSKSFIRIKLPKTILYENKNDLELFFQRSFIIWGHVFQAFYAKENNSVFLAKVNQMMQADGSLKEVTDEPSLEDYVMWFNPLDQNRNQPISKWAARFSLGFSNSVPGPRIGPEDILHEDDIISEEKSEMTDGCGFCNFKLLACIRERFDLENIPTAIQFRLGGFKGMLILRTEDDRSTSPEDNLKIWVRPSQTKIKGQPSDPSHAILDLLRPSYIHTPSHVSPETIINISENSFDYGDNPVHQVLTELMKKALMDFVEGLTVWDGEDAMFRLWANVDKVGNVSSMRRERGMGGEKRFKALWNKDYEDDSEGEDDEQPDREKDGDLDDTTGKNSTAWWPDQVSGCPSSLEETVLYLLDGGFTPQRCPILRDKLQKVVTSKIVSKIENMKIFLDHSATAFAIPDPFGVLEPDEIQLKSSHYNLRMSNGMSSNIVLGDVLVTRYPCKLPTDIRKVKAVEHPQLYKYTDVIVCSIKGKRRFIDYLGGGDYDGDTVLAIWEPKLVQPFKNADDTLSIEPDDINPNSPASCFLASNVTVGEFSEQLQRLANVRERTQILQKYLLGALLRQSLTGIYSKFHDTAVYKYGYSSPEAILLAYKFCKVLDGPKSGLHLKDGVLKEDHRRFGETYGPAWKDPKHKELVKPSNYLYTERLPSSPFIKGPFIMDVMNEAGKELEGRLKDKVNEIFFTPRRRDFVCDDDLERPWLTESRLVERDLGITETCAQEAVAPKSSADSTASTVTATSGDTNTIMPSNVKRFIAQAKSRDLERIRQHVVASYQMHGNSTKAINRPQNDRSVRKGKLKQRRSSGDTSGADFTNLPIRMRQDILRKVSQFFHMHPKPEEMEVYTDEKEIARLKASYAFIYDLDVNKYTKKWSRFPFDVAARDLCAIKASASGPSKTVKGSFYERFKMGRLA